MPRPPSNHLGECLIGNKRAENKKRRNKHNFITVKENALPKIVSKEKITSVTQQSALDEFVSLAELANNDFTASKPDYKIIVPTSIITQLEKQPQRSSDLKNQLRIPRRPAWTRDWTSEELDAAEKEMFLNWRRDLSMLQSENDLSVTPYERNLDLWRQLWRVVEKSHVVVQILDARNPELFRCEDLEEYVKEVDPRKESLLLINKADLLNTNQRRFWYEHFERAGVSVLFWSALNSEVVPHSSVPSECSDESDESDLLDQVEDITENLYDLEITKGREEETECSDPIDDIDTNMSSVCEVSSRDPWDILSVEDLLLVLGERANRVRSNSSEVCCIGMIGYPNVGKSSTINSLMSKKKTAVSATPGRTKHLQTHYLNLPDERLRNLMVCDCPGLVMPNFVTDKAELVLSSILPIHQLIDYVTPAVKIMSRFTPQLLAGFYNIDFQETSGTPNKRTEDFLSALCVSRNWMSKRRPNYSKAAMRMIKDYSTGCLLYCHPPPGIGDETYQPTSGVITRYRNVKVRSRREYVADVLLSKFDETFFRVENKSKGYGIMRENPMQRSAMKSGRKNPRRKLRNVYAHLDKV